MFEKYILVFGPPICAGLGAMQIPLIIKDSSPLNWFGMVFCFALAVVNFFRCSREM